MPSKSSAERVGYRPEPRKETLKNFLPAKGLSLNCLYNDEAAALSNNFQIIYE